MFTSIALTSVRVLDQQEALDFYVGTLGFEIQDDVDMGFMRWLTIALPGAPDRQLIIEVPGPPAVSPTDAAQIRDLLTKGALGVVCVLQTDDCRATFTALTTKGVEIAQDLTEQPYGIECAFRDPFGNHIRVVEPKEGPIEVSEADIARWRGDDT